ncbi:DNA-3-methyladenine glycosylase family protein [Haloferax sp. S1W]|uniref:DNA-3-methyladenine glycosylase family protein n=1 Tax=Haloferax sp. S1W TaxID=3377110 RepID=UPI0037C8D058
MATTERVEEAKLSIRPVEPFEFEQSLAFLRGFLPCSGDHRCSTHSLTVGGYADALPFVAVVTEDNEDTLSVEVDWLETIGDLGAVGDWLRAFLSLDDDLTVLYETAKSDPAFERVVDDLYGYHHVRFSTPFEAACWAALSQRTPMQVSKHLKRVLVETCGRIVEDEGEEILLFPTAEMVRDDAPAVRDAIDNERKAKTVLAAADAFASEDLSALDDATLRERLTDIWGFGEWSSEFVALRGFGRLSGIPRTERRLREAVAELYELGTEQATDADLDRLSEPYEPLEGYWAHYIRVWAFRESLDG